MKLLDQNTSQVFHVPELVLMEQASMAFVQKLLLLKQNKLSTALIACGSGNNGGDGLAIARLLREQGIFVFVWLAGEEEGHRTSSSYDVQKQICSAYSIPVVQKEKVSAGEASYDVVIDALFGTGLSRGNIRRAALINAVRAGLNSCCDIFRNLSRLLQTSPVR